MRRLILLALGGVLMAAVIASAYLWHQWQGFEQRPLGNAGPVALQLEPGTGFGDMVGKLEHLGLTRRDWRWRLFGRLARPVIKAGEYRLPSDATVGDLIERVTTGDVLRHRFTIVEGWTFRQLARALAGDTRLRKVAVDLDDEALMRRLGCEGCAPEGRFLPETYFFARGSTDLELLRRAHAAMTETLEAVWQGRDRSLPLDSPYELLTLASLIERETRLAAERERVAGVFVRRLERGMRLQTDPTVAYGLGDDWSGRLRRVHLRTDHPWNTYTRHGLPPTPIALPGRASLEAAAHPAEGSALYFVARGDGSHYFSDTLAEHNRAVDRFIRGRDR